MAPIINDVTTDLDNPPQFSSSSIGDLPASFKDAIRTSYADLKPLQLSKSKAEVFQAAVTATSAMPRWQITHQDEDAGVIEGFATTLIMRFKDDIVIRLQEKDGKTVVDMRSKSRVGKGDLGANAARIREYFQRLKDLV